MKVTPERMAAFCAALAESCQVRKACTAVDITAQTAYRWRTEFPEFAKDWDEALKAGLLNLESEAHRRAFDGVDEPLTHQGRMTYRIKLNATTGTIERDEAGNVMYELDANGKPIPETMKKYSDTLAIFLLKAHAPAKYRENTRMELTGADGGPVEIDDHQAVAKLAALLEAAKQRKDEAESMV